MGLDFVFDHASSGMRHFAREKVLGPAKPLWFLKGCGFTLEAGEVYQVC